MDDFPCPDCPDPALCQAQGECDTGESALILGDEDEFLAGLELGEY